MSNVLFEYKSTPSFGFFGKPGYYRQYKDNMIQENIVVDIYNEVVDIINEFNLELELKKK